MFVSNGLWDVMEIKMAHDYSRWFMTVKCTIMFHDFATN